MNLPAEIVDRIRKLGFTERLSSSSIVEYALVRFIGEATDDELASVLTANGATLRRP